ncbi:MAG: 5-methylthioadenosine/S-adenosylhomocysteine deaminase, partial [Rhodospirillales bacterium]|nr:5-methylthioadenosine/S-adenosylhomocysteine deaminase [Rhodospirillales bacterium]
MTTIIHDATIITVDASDTVHHGAAIAIDRDRITAIGPSETIVAGNSSAELIDGRGKAVMPGFANIHTHFSMIIAKGIYEDLSPPNKPPFTSGLAPIPLPDLDSDEMRVMC